MLEMTFWFYGGVLVGEIGLRGLTRLDSTAYFTSAFRFMLLYPVFSSLILF